MATALHHSIVTAPGAQPERLALVLHGILGKGMNWRGFARRMVALDPTRGVVLVDLRAHGDSRDLPPPDSLSAAADDLAALNDALDRPVDTVLGHSFGGKVALAYAARAPAALRHLFSVDSLPAARPDRAGSEGTMSVIETLEALPERFEDRAAFVAHMEERGHSPVLANWLAQSLDRIGEPGSGAGVRFGLEMPRIRALLADYFETDLMPTLDPPPRDVCAHLVIAGRSSVYSSEHRAAALELSRRHPSQVRVHVLEEADHWVHVDDPDGLLEIVRGAWSKGDRS